jgi:hypothetical protein
MATHAAAPFVGENYFRSVVVERRRVPIRKALVHHLIDPYRIDGIGHIQKDAVPRARPGGEAYLRKDGDIVALIGQPRSLGPGAVVASLPQAGDCPGTWIGEDARPVDNPGLPGRPERHLNHIDAEERRVGILLGIERRAPRDFVRGSNDTGSRSVDIKVELVVRVGQQGVRT